MSTNTLPKKYPHPAESGDEDNSKKISSVYPSSEKKSRVYDPNAFYPFRPLDEPQRTELVNTAIRVPYWWQLLLCRDKLPASGKNYYTELMERRDVIDYLAEGKRCIRKEFRGSAVVTQMIEDYGWEHPELQPYLYREYYSGIGLITGNSSDGLLAIDVDGASAQPLLELILGGEPPKTVSWTSGKPGRYQMIFQVPRSHWERFEDWVTCIPKSYAELPKAFRDKYPVSPDQELITPDKGELLEFRYNGRYSVLPPSRHPTTGMYKWIHSALDTKVAPLPERLLDLITAWTDLEAIEAEKKEQRQLEFAQKKAEREAKKAEKMKSGVVVDDSDCDEFDDIIEAAQELNNRAGIDGFDWYGHDFEDHGGGWLQGNCPRHESTSGTSFQVEIDGDHAWRCHACDVGSIGLANYLIWRETGEIKWSGNFSILKPYFTEYGIKLKNSFKKKDSTTKTVEFSERLKQHFEARNLPNSGYPYYSESTPYCSENFLANIPHSGIVGIQAAMGVGKSTALKQWLTTTDTPKIFIYNRIALGYSQAISLSGNTPQEKVNWIDDVQVSDFLQGRVKRIGLCYDSLHKLGIFTTNQPFHLILDECESGLIHLLTGETHRLNRAENISALCKLLALANATNGGCILSDATLRKSTIKYIAQFMPDSPVKVLINTTKPKKRNVVLTGKEKASFFETTVAQLVKSDTPALVASDSKENLQALESLVQDSLVSQEKTPKSVIRLDSDTSRTDEARGVMNNLNQSILTKTPDLFMFSPTLANGLSIDVVYFQKAYGLFFAINTPIESIQQMARDRHLTDWSIYATKGKYHGAVTVDAVIADKKRQESNLTEISDQLIKEVLRQHTANNFTDSTATDNPDYINGKALIGLLEKFLEGDDYPTLSPKHSWYYYELVANQNWARANYYDVMVAELRAAGHSITFADGIKNSYSEVIKETIELTRLESCEKVAAVEAIFTDYATAHSAEQMACDPEIQRQGTKSKILISTGILEPECTVSMVYHWKYNYREVIHANLLWFLYKNPHLVPTLDVSKLKRYAKNYHDGLEFCLQDVKLLGYKVHALTKYFKIQELESILDLENPNLTFSSSTPGLKDWALRVNKVSARIKNELATEFNDNFPKIIAGANDVRSAKLATWILEKLGYSFTSQKVGKQYTYTFSSEFLSGVTRQNLLAGYDRKYNQTPDVVAKPNDVTIDDDPLVISIPQMTLDTLPIAPTTGRTLETILKGLNNYETLTPNQVFADFQEVITLHEILPLNDLGNPNTLEYYCKTCDPNFTAIQLEDMVRVTLAVLRIRQTFASGEEYTPEFKAVETPHLYVQNLLANYQRNEDDALLTDGKLAFKLLRQDVTAKGMKYIKD